MKKYLGIRDTDDVYLPERKGSESKMFGIDVEEKNFARIKAA
jgi:hypothetical protein